MPSSFESNDWSVDVSSFTEPFTDGDFGLRLVNLKKPDFLETKCWPCSGVYDMAEAEDDTSDIVELLGCGKVDCFLGANG